MAKSNLRTHQHCPPIWSGWAAPSLQKKKQLEAKRVVKTMQRLRAARSTLHTMTGARITTDPPPNKTSVFYAKTKQRDNVAQCTAQPLLPQEQTNHHANHH